MLHELRENFWRSTVHPGDRFALAPCFFARLDHRPCEGVIQACHFSKRQRVRNALGALFDWGAVGTSEWNGLSDLIELAEWDARNGVPGCLAHHQRFDSQRMPPLVVPRHLAPAAIKDFCRDWGLESALEDRCPERSEAAA